MKNQSHINQREKAEQSYYANPNICKHCGRVIELSPTVKVSETRRKVFCNHSCASSYNNRGIQRNKPRSFCVECGSSVRRGTLRCQSCLTAYYETLANRTKAEVNRQTIAKHSRKIAFRNRDKVCEVCGYDKHVEVCHIKPVSSFPDTTTLAEINHPSNLRLLCPNHHWEFDHTK